MKKKIKLLLVLTTLSLFIVACTGSKSTTATNEEATTEEVVTASTTEEHNVLVVVNTATWCGTCRSNGPRVEEEILSKYMNDERYQVIVNNLSDETTITESNKALEEAGILNFASENNGTGLIYMLNADSKEMISKISVSKSTEKIIAELDAAIVS